MNKITYIQIDPILTDLEIEIFKNFDIACFSAMALINAPLGIWHGRSNDHLAQAGGFEIVSIKKNSHEDLKNSLKIIKQNINWSFSSDLWDDNFKTIIQLPAFFIETELKHIQNLNHKFNYSTAGAESQLHKIVNFFHEDGYIRKLLGINLPPHNLNSIVVNPFDDEYAYIVENQNIFEAKINSKGLYEKIKNTKDYWSDEQLIKIEKTMLNLKIKNNTKIYENNDEEIKKI